MVQELSAPGGVGSSVRVSDRPAPASLRDVATAHLRAFAAHEPAFTPGLEAMVGIFGEMLGPHAGRVSPNAAEWPSDVGDDHTPYEFSIAVGGSSPELRILVESPAEENTITGRWRVARSVVATLAERHGADARRLDAIADLFAPTDPRALFALWHAVSFWPNKKPELKAYLNLQAHGPDDAGKLLEEALARLGLAAAYPSFMANAVRRGQRLDELKYIALDLADHERARVKVYARHHHIGTNELERVLGSIGGVKSGDVRAACATLLGGDGPFTSRPIATCWAFTGAPTPTGATLYAPLPYYAHDDGEIALRLRRYLAEVGVPGDGYERALAVAARRPLERGVGLHSYASFKRDRGAPKVTVYFAPELYRTFSPGSLARPDVVPQRTPEEIVTHFETRGSIANHPLFRRLDREPTRLDHIWTILANGREGIGASFPRWLASVVARVESDEMRSVLAKQLNDELGNGNPEQAHGVLYQKMLDDLAAHAPTGDLEKLLAPGRALARGLADLYTARDAYEGIGATLLMEVFGKQADQRVGGLLRRQTVVDPKTLTWLVLHEELEEEHAGESMELAEMAPRDARVRAAMSRGAEELAVLAWRYFDDLYGVLFP